MSKSSSSSSPLLPNYSINKSSSLSLSIQESKSILSLSLPMTLTSLLLYSRSLISLLFLGHLGSLPLAAGSLSIAFSNITAYSLLSGLSLAMEPICSQSFGSRNLSLLSHSLHQTTLLLLSVSVPLIALSLNIQPILRFFAQPNDISSLAHSYVLFSLPDLLLHSFLHPMRIYLRTQSITMPLTYAAALALSFHLAANYLLVVHLQLGIKGVALASVSSNFVLVLSLALYIYFSGIYHRTDRSIFSGWRTLLGLAIPSCISVCLEWWWYEIMILLSGLLLNPRATVASMGVRSDSKS